MEEKVTLMIAGSSRVRTFETLSSQNEQKYTTVILPNPGAGYLKIAADVVKHIADIDNNNLIVVYIIGGLCDITEKVYHKGGCEVLLRQHTLAIEHARDAKLMIRTSHPNVIVSFASVAVADLAKTKRHYKKQKQLWESCCTDEETQAMQNRLSDTIAEVNKELSILNQIPQSTRDYDLLHLSQLFTHHHIEKISYNKRGTRKTNIRKTIPNGALPDGVHQSKQISQKWFDQLHKIVLDLIPNIRKTQL